MNGGYDDGYRGCPCFWGAEPGSLVRLLSGLLTSMVGMRVLDAGCGEGKNSAFLAQRGATVDAIDVSELAIRNGRRQWPDVSGLNWQIADIQSIDLPQDYYDVVIGYGVLHCMPNEASLRLLLSKLHRTTRVGGHNVLCAFNSRSQDLSAHPGFTPTLISHAAYLQAYVGWRLMLESDADLTEQHPHNGIVHTHSLTRILAQRTLL